MASLRGLVFLIAVCLTGCTAPVEDEGCEDMRQVLHGRQRIEQWGNSQVIPGPWPENVKKTALQHKPYREDDPRTGEARYCIPVAQSILLTSNLIIPSGSGSPNRNWAFRWALNVGGGGGSQTVLIDALNIQQVSLAAENVDVSILCEKITPTSNYFAPDDIQVKTGVSFADGNVTSSRATYTQAYALPTGATTIALPAMANALLIGGGDGQADSPFLAGLSYRLGNVVLLGPGLLPGFYASDFIELPGDVPSLIVTNANATTAFAVLQWGLDL